MNGNLWKLFKEKLKLVEAFEENFLKAFHKVSKWKLCEKLKKEENKKKLKIKTKGKLKLKAKLVLKKS